jgi:hypothetical protein
VLARIEALLDDAELAWIEALLPVGVRPRQLSVRTLLVGVLVCLADGRPAHLTRVHAALLALSPEDSRRLGIIVAWKSGLHVLTYRQVERTFSLVAATLADATSGGSPSALVQRLVDALSEASVPEIYKEATSSYAVDWTDMETFGRPVSKGESGGADPDASWGHRNATGQRHDLFFGYFVSGITMVHDEGTTPVPELCRRILVTSCHLDPVPALVPVISHMVEGGVRLGDVLCDSGYAHRVPEHWALPLRALGAKLVMDLHPHDRGTRGTHQGAISFNGSLYCPSTPKALFDLEPLARGATLEVTAAHDRRCAELARYKLGRISADDADGYHRTMCPASMGKLRCPLRPDSMTLAHDRPEIPSPPKHPPTCCIQQTITVGPAINAKTAQKHDYPSPAHRQSYSRRTAAERTNSTVKDPASTDITRGWCRVMGLTAMTLFVVCAFIVRNGRVLDAYESRQHDAQRRLEAGLAQRTRRRRRQTISDLVGAAAANAPP